MLTRRVVGVVPVRNGVAVQSIGFRRYLPLGRPEIAVSYLDRWGIDEIVLADISASREGRGPDYAMVQRVASECHVPLTVAGGITEAAQIGDLLSQGADKVAVNKAVWTKPDLLTEGAHLFGSQCIVASIDAVAGPTGDSRVFNYLSNGTTEVAPVALAQRCVDLGAGEVLLNSVDRDGSYAGFDIDLIDRVAQSVTVPVIAIGGAGRPSHFEDAFAATGASALGAGNFFHFWEHSVTIVKAMIGAPAHIRRETAFNYDRLQSDPSGRLSKKDDADLEQMLYVRVEKEII